MSLYDLLVIWEDQSLIDKPVRMCKVPLHILKEAIKELKKDYYKQYSHNRPTCDFFDEIIEKEFGEKLI